MFELNPMLNLENELNEYGKHYIHQHVFSYVMHNIAPDVFEEVMSSYFVDINEHIELIENKTRVIKFFLENKSDILSWLISKSTNDFSTSKIDCIRSYIDQKTGHSFNVDDIAKVIHTDDIKDDQSINVVRAIARLVINDISDAYKSANKGDEYEGVDDDLLSYLSVLGTGRFITKNTHLMKSYLNSVDALDFQDMSKDDSVIKYKGYGHFWRGNSKSLLKWLDDYTETHQRYSSLNLVLELTNQENPDLVVDLDDVAAVLFANDSDNPYYDKVLKALLTLFSREVRADYKRFLAKREAL